MNESDPFAFSEHTLPQNGSAPAEQKPAEPTPAPPAPASSPADSPSTASPLSDTLNYEPSAADSPPNDTLNYEQSATDSSPNGTLGFNPEPPSMSPHSSGTIAAPVNPRSILPENNELDISTMAAPAGYDPASALAASTRASKVSHQPSFFEAKEPLVGGRFEIIRAHARGGMGQVSVARDSELNREVALKEIQPRFTPDAATVARFVLEAQVTGKLEHPGIVPVYSRGQRTDGSPYYAMRFVSGLSFQQAIDEFHAADKSGRDLQERSLALRQLLRRFVDVCNTIAFAHAKGILHRDIKPANILLGGYGETLVVDWGLAKEMKSGDAPPQSGGLGIPVKTDDVNDFDATKVGYTLYGQAMGTPAFMSPEQAAGQWDVTGVASDVYSLGAMLYTILSGSPPFSGPTMEVLTKVQRGDFKPIHAVKGNIPGPLGAVCRKSMSLKIEDRYRSALELSSDVERWLADEPVSCYEEPLSVRLMRWARRHRTAVTTAAALVITGAVALALGLFAVNREKIQTKKAYDLAAESRTETRDALLTVTDDAVGEILVSSAKPTEQQKKFLENLIGIYKRFAEKDDNLPETRLFIANSMIRLGRLQSRINQNDAAIESYETALSRLADKPANPGAEWKNAEGMAHLYYGIFKLQRGDASAEEQFQRAVEEYTSLVATQPTAENRYRLSQSHDRLGVFYLTRNRWKDAGAEAEKALSIREQLAKDFPDNAEYQFRFAQSLRQRAAVQSQTQKRSDAVATLKRAKEIEEKIVEANPTVPQYLALLADIEQLLTEYTAGPPLTVMKFGSLSDQNKETESMGFARDSVKSWGKLLSLYPGDTLYRRKLAEANYNLAEQAQNSGNARVAISAIDAAKTVVEELNRDLPNNPLTEQLLGLILHNRAAIFRGRGNRLAGEAAAQAVSFVEARLAANQNSLFWLVISAKCRLEEEMVFRADHQTEKAKAALEAAWQHLAKAVALGNTEMITNYLRVAGESLAERKDDSGADAVAKRLSELPLPKGQSYFDAARFRGHYSDNIFLQPDYQDATDAKRRVLQLQYAMQLLNIAIDKGFNNLEALKTTLELGKLREAFEFGALMDRIRVQ